LAAVYKSPFFGACLSSKASGQVPFFTALTVFPRMPLIVRPPP
jgi:hypothetical protein